MSKKSLFLVVAVCLLAISPAFADQMAFNFTGTGPAGNYTATGTMTVTAVYWHTYLVTGLTGTFNGAPNSMTLLNPGGFASNDNLVYDTAPGLDTQGVSFLVGGIQYNLFNWGNGGTVATCQNSNCLTRDESGNPSTPVTFNVNSVPEPASFALLGSGLLGLIGLGRRQLKSR